MRGRYAGIALHDGDFDVQLQIGDALHFDGLVGFGRPEHGAQDVHRPQQQLADPLRDGDPFAAQLIQQRFEAVGEGGDFAEAEGGAAPLYRMGDAEDRIDGLRVRAAGVELEQGRFHRVHSFEAFVEKRVVKLGEIDGHGTLSPGS